MPKSDDVSWKQYRDYSGPVIQGLETIVALEGDQSDSHVHRAFWLTTMVETGGKLGAIMAADGTAMTAGLDQHIAVYPKALAHEDYNAADDQGSLWKLLRRLETVRSSKSYQQAVDNLWAKLAGCGWYVSQDGALRYREAQEVYWGVSGPAGQPQPAPKKIQVKAGDLVFGSHIRNTFTPNGGKVPSSGKQWEQAKEWALLFHALTAHVGGEAAQIEFGIEHLVKRTKRRDVSSTGGQLEEVGYGTREITSLRLGKDWPEELDLAMCMYQAHSVNAPGAANSALATARAKAMASGSVNQLKFAKLLIEQLGNSTYGRWDDDIQYGRYQRTRSAARASGLWTRGLFDGTTAIMPKDLAG